MEILNLSERLSDPKTFPALPDVVTSIIHEIDLGAISIANLGKIVQKDVGFATQIIRHANTGAYIAAGQVTTITQAIRLIGFRMLKGFCLTVPLFTSVRHVPGIDALWYHSRVTSLCSRILAEKIAYPEPEVAETAGLLHDIGKVYLALHEQAFFYGKNPACRSGGAGTRLDGGEAGPSCRPLFHWRPLWKDVPVSDGHYRLSSMASRAP